MTAAYNDVEPYVAAWMRHLMDAGHIARGCVFGGSVVDMQPDDVRPYEQFHAFAGVGVWSRALRLADWPDDEPVWTGSCPCQPFSAAGKKGGFSDARHLWPEWFRLIKVSRPPVVFGEQVASPDGLKWLDAVSADLEGAGYAFGAADLCAAGVGAPHQRQRLYFAAVADRESLRRVSRRASEARARAAEARIESERRGDVGAGAVANDDGEGLGLERSVVSEDGDASPRIDADRCGATRGFWGGADWIPCRDGKWRPVEPGSFPLAHGAPSRMGRLRAYGNAIVAPLASTFIRAVMETA